MPSSVRDEAIHAPGDPASGAAGARNRCSSIIVAAPIATDRTCPVAVMPGEMSNEATTHVLSAVRATTRTLSARRSRLAADTEYIT